MIVALIDMEYAFILLQYFSKFVQCRMDTLQRKDDGKGWHIKKAQDAEESLLSKGTTLGGKLKNIKIQFK